MSGNEIPADAPPSYQAATGSSSSTSRPANVSQTSDGHLAVGQNPQPQGANGLSVAARRSMEDEMRPLPKGWVRSFDPESKHQFFVDTRQDPPRSIWVHPYDDEEYLRTLSSDERERIEQESMNRGHNPEPSKADIMASHTDDEDDEQHQLRQATSSSSSNIPGELPPRPDGKGKGKDNRSFGRKWKDKITGSSHEQREAERKRRAEEERKQYERHQALRIAMAKAAETGKPQFVGTDSNGKDVYVDPPGMQMGPAGYGVNAPGSGYSGRGYGYGAPYGGYGYGYSPYGYPRPVGPYRRPYGGGYGGGYGLPLALGGGLLGGLLIGDALGGF